MHELVQQIARVDFSNALIAGHQLGRSYAAPASGNHTLGAFKYLLLDKDAVFQRI